MADSHLFDDGISFDYFSVLEDFPFESIPYKEEEPEIENNDWDQFPNINTMCFSGGLLGEFQNDFSKENKNLSQPYDETGRLHQFPNSTETTSSGGGNLLSDDSSDVKPTHFFKTSSPVSILESSGSCFSSENLKASIHKIINNPVKRARTKRPRSRPSSFERLSSLPFFSATNSNSANSESDWATKTFKPAKRIVKKNKKKRVSPVDVGVEDPVPRRQTGETKKCTHCEVTSTPQWREGPKGPKTLCNACGVRFRSGRLFPEYRPAASPTFVSSVHSNSHKKVVEMRNKACPGSGNSSSRVGVKLYYRSQAGSSVMQLIV